MNPNTLYYGDCLDWMGQCADQSVDLIYLDPPFNSNADYNMLYSSAAGGAQFRAFNDTWYWDEAAADRYAVYEGAPGRPARSAVLGMAQVFGQSGMLAYLTYMAERLEQMHRLLRPTGSIYLHCDPTASHGLKLLMDSIFGRQNFRNEIIWKRTFAHGGAKRYGPVHDVILFYTRGDQFRWTGKGIAHDRTYIEDRFTYSDQRGRYQAISLTGAGTRTGDSGKPWRGTNPTDVGRHWAISARSLTGLSVPAYASSRDKLNALNEAGRLHWPNKSNGVPRLKQYADSLNGMPPQDIWTDIPPVGMKGKERLGYPTQKPWLLLKRIIEASSNPGDLILDPFCGCGTAIEAGTESPVSERADIAQ